MAGIKLRTPRGRWRVRLFQSLGANPTPMSLSETFMALQTGVIDGQENPLSQIHSQKFHEVQKYLSLTGHVYTPAYLLAGAGRWRALPRGMQEVLERTAQDLQPYVYAQGRKARKAAPRRSGGFGHRGQPRGPAIVSSPRAPRYSRSSAPRFPAEAR